MSATRRDGTDYGKVQTAATCVIWACRARAKTKETVLREVVTATGFPIETVDEAFVKCGSDRSIVPVRGSEDVFWRAT